MQSLLKAALAAGLLLASLASATAQEVMMTSFYRSVRPDIAAHKTLPFGTHLRITNPRNGRTTTVVIHDRGPFIVGRQLDISNERARELGFVAEGVIPLDVEILK